MAGGFEEMEAIFGQVEEKEEKEEEGLPKSEPFFFHVYGLRNDHSALVVCVTDFHSNTWQAVKSHQQLEDMRDMAGIGGSWSEFVDYVIASLKSEDVKLVLEVQSKSGAGAHAKLVAQKAKGMPIVSISLTKLVDAAASEATAKMAQELFKELKKSRNLLIKEQERCCQVSKILDAEQEKSESLQRQVDTVLFSRRQKLQKTSDKSMSDVTQDSSDIQGRQTTASTKVSNRVVPAYRRAKVRGVLLQDTEDEQD